MPEPTDSAPTPPRGLVIAWGVTLLVLLAVTWRLWTPLRDAPRVPPLFALSGLPVGLDFAWLALIGVGVVRAIRTPRHARRAIGVATIALAVSMAMDQLRWQPWAHHALLAGAVLATTTPRRAVSVLRWIAIAARRGVVVASTAPTSSAWCAHGCQRSWSIAIETASAIVATPIALRA